MFDQISIIGCGLIGSSIFKGLKKVGFQETEVNDILGNNWYNFYRGINN